MRNLKKVLVLVLSLAMMLSIMVVGAGAFTDTDKIDDAHQEAVEIATQLNIINGYPDGSFKPEGFVTRAEISKMICIALNGGEVPATAVKAEPSYNDIQGNWAEGFIEYCTAKGIIAGYPDGSFKPGDNVTGAEAAKMMLVALGYDPKAENYEGEGWDLYVNVQANQDGLYVDLLDVDKLTTEPLTREHTAQMIWNMLQAFTVEKTTNVDRTDGTIRDTYAKTETTLFWETYRGYQGKAQLVGFKYDKDATEWTYYLDVNYNFMDQQVGTKQNQNTANAVARGIEFTSKTDYTALLGHDVEAIFNIDSRNATYKANVGKVYGIFNDSSIEVVTARFGDIGKITAKTDIDTMKINGDTYRLDKDENGRQLTFGTVPVYEFRSVNDITANTVFGIPGASRLNGNAYAELIDVVGGYNKAVVDRNGNKVLDANGNQTYEEITRYDPQKFTAIDEDGNGKIDFLITTPFSFVQVDSLNGSKIQLYGAFVDNVNVDDPYWRTNDPDAFNAKRWLSDQVSMYDGIAKGDWVKFTAAVNTSTDVDVLEKPDSVFSGSITKSDYPDVTVDGKAYSFVDQHFYTGKGTSTSASKNGNVLTDAMVINDYIFRVGSLKRASFDDYALVISTSGVSGVNGPQAKMLFTDGTTKIVDTEYDYTWIPDGMLVEYYVKDGEYHFTVVNNLEDQGGDYSMSDVVSQIGRISNSDGNIGNLFDRAGNRADINDDAVVFVKYIKDNGQPGYKAITGKQLKVNPTANLKVDYWDKNTNTLVKDAVANTINAGNVIGVAGRTGCYTIPNTMVLATADAPKSSINHTEFAYIDLTQNGVITSKDYYGYILDKEKDPTTGMQHLTLWTADGQKDAYYADENIVVYSSNGTPAIDPQDSVIESGMAIRYRTNANESQITEILGYYNMETEDTTSNNSVDGFRARTIAITNLPDSSDANQKFEFVDYTLTNGVMMPNPAKDIAPNGKYFDIEDADTLFVDIENDAGYSSDNVLDTASRDKNGNFASNAMIVYEADGTVDLIVYFVDGE